jgi:phage baseplate assembly protein W
MTIQTTRPNARYKDFYINFDAHPVRKDLFVLEDTDSIKNAIKNILFTDPGERFFAPYFGGGIRASLFENIDINTAYMIRKQVEMSIENFEPRAQIIQVIVTPYEDQNAYAITVVFSTINNPDPVVFNTMLTRVR